MTHKTRWKRYLFPLLTTLIVVGGYFPLARFCEKRTDTFTIGAISSNRPFDPAWQTHPLTPEQKDELDSALAQKYHYFGKGGQCYAFFSKDGNYVVKFFKQRVYQIPLWHRFIPIPYLFDRYKEKKRLKRLDKIQRDFFSYKVAFEDLQEITGILYVHLNQTTDLKKTLAIVDLLNIEHRLDLDKFDFIVQRRADMIYPTLSRLIDEGNSERSKQIIDQVIDLIVHRCRKGYEDWDSNIRTNCGLLNNAVIKIDVGRFIANKQMKSSEMCRSELLRVTTPFKEWLKDKDPALANYCDEAVAKAAPLR